MTQTPPPEPECLVGCPNRRRDGINLTFFKRTFRLDPFELMLFALILAGPVGISLKDAWDGKIDFEESAKRIGMISALGTVVRLSPTEQVSNLLSSFSLGKK
ncbi:MAG: hypothetical protein V7L20_26170 [Nostoc sp.]|uniref:hypothetical protein n=1 Tax=Nostoc sp. TaxID=1180 RepID=UPI002FFCE0EB